MSVVTRDPVLAALVGTQRPNPHDPRVEIRVGAALIALFLFGFLGWSALARLDAAIHTPGVVRVAGNRQAVQTEAGGTINAIKVHEGDHVAAGQTLVEFATTEALAQERSLASRMIGLQAEIARIEAERDGSDIVAPAQWTAFDPSEREEADRALAGERNNLAARRALVGSERAVMRQQLAEVSDQIGGYRQRQSSNTRQGALNRDELAGVQALFQKGYATKTRVLTLQRSAASIDGEIGTTAAEIARLQTSAGETRLQMMRLADQRDQENADRLRTARTELETVVPQWRAAREQLSRSAVRAPVAGTVLGLSANTVGGVAAPGQTLMSIVPAERTLEIEAQVALADVLDLRPGQPASVRLTGALGRDLPPLHGYVRRISADSIVDDKTGRSFFVATLRVPPAELDRVSRIAGIAVIKPGIAVDVTIPTRARTALRYWIDPLTERLRPALAER